MTYTPYYPGGWEDSPLTSTPIVAAALENMESGIGAASSAVLNGGWVPSANSLLGANFPMPAITGAASMVAGTIYLSKLPIVFDDSVRYLWWLINNAGSGTSTGCFAGLYDNTGTRVAVSSDIGANLKNYTDKQQLGAPVSLSAGQTYWSAILSNLSGSQPQLCTGFNGDPGIATLNQGAGPDPGGYSCSVNGTGQTSLPSSLNLSSNSVSGAIPFWVGYNLAG